MVARQLTEQPKPLTGVDSYISLLLAVLDITCLAHER